MRLSYFPSVAGVHREIKFKIIGDEIESDTTVIHKIRVIVSVFDESGISVDFNPLPDIETTI